MTSMAWFCAGFGVAVGVVMILAVCIDVEFVAGQITTISRRSLDAATRAPAIGVAVSGVLCLLVGMLLGHLFFGQAP